ncbi:MAG: class I SAM-dependent methyltransferase [Bacteroidales bacterium]|nr:class I SAM-dependent methyltransferase [Bacteroidales bacterium]
MPWLLQDMWAMGCSLESIITAAGSVGLHHKSKVLDLGRGKGAVCVQLAGKFGCNVLGIDATEPFLKDAQTKASEHKVSSLCDFVQEDILEYVKTNHNFDLVILASLGGIFGSFKNTVATLRSQVIQGGYMIVDDGYLQTRDSLNRKGYGHYRNHKNTISELTSYGDKLIMEINTTDISRQINDEYMHVIEKRGKELVTKHPEIKEEIEAYILLQHEECEVIDKEIEGALWLLQKKD